MILARAAYLGAQRNGTVFWSSDIQSTWDMLKRSIPAGLNFTASGMPYWDTDIAGFFSPPIPADYHAAHKPLIDGSDARGTIGNYEDYPELFVRWFEWGAFQPVMRAHGERESQRGLVVRQAGRADSGEVSAAALSAAAVHLLACLSQPTRLGAPYMRALFMDFPDDPKAADIPDEYMYGPAFLVAPVTEQGATQPQGVSARRLSTGTTTGPMSAYTADRRFWRMPRSTRCRCLCGREASCRLAQTCRARKSGRQSRPYECIPERMARLRFFRTTATPTHMKAVAAP